ncbi:MAG: lamin tail domain-containing protein [Cystobacterineae bacterium]|nr:lamin tail domain-containing protein [Cystobacterineae bacterium]
MQEKNRWLCGVVGMALGMALACVERGNPIPPEGHVPLEEGQLLMMEIMADPQGIDTEKEYIEIYNPTDEALSLWGLELFLIPGTTGKEKRFALPRMEIPPGAYVVLGDVPPERLPAHVDIGYARALGALPNTQATVGLRNIGGDTIDSASYSSTKVGRALSRQGTHADALWCYAEADTTYDGVNYGSPQKPNAACTKNELPTVPGETEPGELPESKLPPGSCVEEGVVREIRVPQPGQLLLNELMVSPGAGLTEAEAEWVELWALEEVDLNGLELRTLSRSQKINADNCLSVEANSYFLLVRSASEQNNGCLEADGLLTLSLPNSSPESDRKSLTLLAGEEVVDTVTYTTAPKARSFQRSPTTLEWCYLPTHSLAIYDMCRGELSGNRGTPRAENLPCS